MSIFNRPKSFDGRISVVAKPSAIAAKSLSSQCQGWAIDSNGIPYVQDAGTQVSGAQYLNGMAFTQDGALYITYDAPAVSDIFSSGVRLRRDGAVKVGTKGIIGSTMSLWAASQANTTIAQYLGYVGTRCMCPGETGSGASREQMSRQISFARDDITSLQCVFPNFWYNGTFTPSGGTLTIEAAIEYPLGTTTTRLLFSAVNQGVISDGSILTTDALAITIPRGAQFAVRSWTQSAVAYLRRSPWQGFAGDGSLTSGAGSTTPNLVMNTGATGGGSTTMYGPVAIIGQTTRPSFYGLGDSIAAGTTDTGGGPSGDFGSIAESLGPFLAYGNNSVSGLRALNVVADSAMHVTLAQYASFIVTNLGTNDLVASARTPAQLIGDLNTIIGLFPGKQFYAISLTPRTSGTWSTYAGQSLIAQEASIESVTATILAKGLTGQTGAFDQRTPLLATVDDGGLAVVNAATWIYNPVLTADGLHPNHTGNLLIKNGAGVVT